MDATEKARLLRRGVTEIIVESEFIDLLESGQGQVASLMASRRTLDVVLAAYRSAGIDRGNIEALFPPTPVAAEPRVIHEFAEIR